ncbi:hypothetical protein FRC11_008493 [Ceratobasidium sp. 423]|nr:hypothetical protein FRC11_008493 [Ceratobasidium sp. 423]
MDTCMSLKNSSLAELATNAEDLVPRIERHIASLSSFVACQVTQTCSVLSTARNQLVSLAYGLPEEVLVEIFTQVIYDPTDDQQRYQHRSLEQDLRFIYRRLYNLISVCSSWRNIAVRKRSFWSMVPMIDQCKCSDLPLEDVTERSLRRSGGTGLYVAAATSLRLPLLLRPLVSYGKHIWALNIKTDTLHTVKEVVSTLAVFSSPKTLSELSICLDSTTVFGGPREEDCELIKQPLQHQERFRKILGSLRALRIRVAQIDLYDVSFVNLLELRIENIQLGYKPIFKRLLRAISSASNLQYLQLVSVTSYLDRETNHLTTSTPPDIIDEDDGLLISFPNLQTVYLSDLFFNDLREIFKSFVPGDEKWILSFGVRCKEMNDFGAYHRITVQDLGLLLRGFNIVTLMLSGRDFKDWLDGPQLSHLLKAVPTATTLKMDYWDFHRQHWEALVLPQGARGVESAGFPSIHNLHIYNARIFDERGIQAVVSSHNIQQLRLGGFLTSISDGYNDGNAIKDGDNITAWLASNVPDFSLMDCYYDPPESSVEDWPLW